MIDAKKNMTKTEPLVAHFCRHCGAPTSDQQARIASRKKAMAELGIVSPDLETPEQKNLTKKFLSLIPAAMNIAFEEPLGWRGHLVACSITAGIITSIATLMSVDNPATKHQHKLKDDLTKIEKRVPSSGELFTTPSHNSLSP